jgi:hypothetical protein
VSIHSPLKSPLSRLRVEALEDRSVPAAIADAPGDFLATYTGVHDPGLDVVAHEAVYLVEQGRVVFYGKMAGSVADTAVNNGVYVIGVDRGLGTPRFLNGSPIIGPNVVWDSIVRVTALGTGNFNNIITGVNTALSAADITISGDEFTVSVPLSLMLPAATRPPEEWTYNLWPRNGAGQNVQVSDLAPDDGNSPVQVVAPARVESVLVNDGSAQRSMVTSLRVTFDGPVTIDAGAFELRRADGSLVALSVATSLANGRTVAVLTFTGSEIIGASLADGNYALAIRGDLVHDRFGRTLDGDADGTAGGDRGDAFHRLFGDSDGDRDVDLHDLWRFLGTLGRTASDPNYLWYFDVNNDARVGVFDLIAFGRRLGSDLDP